MALGTTLQQVEIFAIESKLDIYWVFEILLEHLDDGLNLLDDGCSRKQIFKRDNEIVLLKINAKFARLLDMPVFVDGNQIVNTHVARLKLFRQKVEGTLNINSK